MATITDPYSSETYADLVIDELTHRFYNSLQIISSLLSQAVTATAAPERTLAKVALVRDRVSDLSNLHRRLAYPRASGDILESHCRDVCLDLLRAFGRDDLTPWFCVEDLVLARSAERRLIFLIVELVTNAIKHGRQDGAGMIWVDVKQRADEQVELRVRDNGEAASIDPCEPAPRMAAALARSLGGELCMSLDEGLTARVHFSMLAQ